MPCQQCANGMWKWGEDGECQYETQEECERANRGRSQGSLGGLPHLESRLFDRPLAITPPKLRAILWALSDRLRLDVSPPALLNELEEEDEPPRAHKIVDGVAVLPIRGTLVQRGDSIDAWSGLLGYNRIGNMLEAAVSDHRAKGVLLDIDSAGGEVSGAFDLADRIRAMRSRSRIHALIQDQGCSAAYLLASATGRVSLTQSAVVGSIGVILAHVDQTGADEARGLKVTEITSGARKADGSPHHALGDDERARLEAFVGQFYDLLVSHVSRNRGMSQEAIRRQEAGIYVGVDAVEQGLAEGVETYESAIQAVRRAASSGGAVARGRRGPVRARSSRRQSAKKPKVKGKRSMTTQNRNQVQAGEQLAELLETAIETEVDSRAGEGDDREAVRTEIVQEMADAAGTETSTVNQILEGQIDCPPLERLEGFSEVLDVSVEDQIEAGRADGCNTGPYAQEGEGGEETEAAGAKTTDELRAEGARAERERIKAIEDLGVKGHEKLIRRMKFDGKTTPEQAAMRLWRAEQDKRTHVEHNLDADAAELDQVEAGLTSSTPQDNQEEAVQAAQGIAAAANNRRA